MIKTENLFRIFKTNEIETTALNNINLQIKKGEFVAIMGTSGCGKSTLLNVLGLLDSITVGSYFFNGIEVSKYTEKQKAFLRKENIAFIFQNFNLIEDLTVFENVELPLIYLSVHKNERKNRVYRVLNRMEIEHRANHFPDQLSGGQQQRAAVARAIITNPKLILADEPTGNLDSRNGEEVMKMLEELNSEGTTIVMVTHSPFHAARANRVINLFDGKIVTEPVKI